jgi:hypothetical protein
MACSECKKRLFPEDPSAPSHGMKPICYGCPNWDYSQYLEVGNGCDDYAPEIKQVIRFENPSPLKAELNYLTNKLNEHIDASNKKAAQRNEQKPSGKGVKL